MNTDSIEIGNEGTLLASEENTTYLQKKEEAEQTPGILLLLRVVQIFFTYIFIILGGAPHSP